MPVAPSSRASSPMRQSSNTSSEVTEARNDSLRWTSAVWKPGAERSTTNPRTPSSLCAHTTATSAMPPFVIHIFEPFSTHPSERRVAVVRMEAGSLPASASVRPKHPMISPRAIRGSHRCFCSSDPKAQIGYIASEPWTEAKLRNPLSAASSSMHASP